MIFGKKQLIFMIISILIKVNNVYYLIMGFLKIKRCVLKIVEMIIYLFFVIIWVM